MRTDRRAFIKTAAAVCAVSAGQGQGRALGANDRIRVGIIGTGGRGQLLMDLFQRSGEAEIVAVCDVYEPRVLQAAEIAGATALKVADYRRITHAARPGDILTFWVYPPDLLQRQLKTIRVDDR